MAVGPTFTATVAGLAACAVVAFVWAENRHRKAEAQRRADEAKRAERSTEYLAANRKHVQTVEAWRKEQPHG